MINLLDKPPLIRKKEQRHKLLMSGMREMVLLPFLQISKGNEETSHQSIRQLGRMDKCLERCQGPKLLEGVTGKMNRSVSIKEIESVVNNSYKLFTEKIPVSQGCTGEFN